MPDTTATQAPVPATAASYSVVVIRRDHGGTRIFTIEDYFGPLRELLDEAMTDAEQMGWVREEIAADAEMFGWLREETTP